MFRHKGSERRDGAGFSLIEMLVASAIFAIAAAVAFILYTAAQKSYKSGEQFTDQQQSTRVAFDRLISDIRLAGFNYNPDGDKTRVDEQVEGVWDTAITIRGDFDFEDPTASANPEASLPGTSYNVVSTGNDEIVSYVLAKPGPGGSDTLTLRLDPDRPRTKALATVTIPNVVLVQNDPPYTLYRVTLADIAGTFPSSPQAASNFVYEPVADNIRTMTFQYYDDGGALLNPNTPASSADDIGGSDANTLTRGRVRRIAVNLVGMTPDEDIDYTDVSDASATTHYRKFDLQSDVNPENLGKTGIKDIDVTPPPSPTNVQLVDGHCGGVLVKWDQPASSAGIVAYSVKYWPNGSPSSFATRGFTYPHLEYGVVDYLGHGFVNGLTTGSTYCFQVQAKDLAGNQSGWAPPTSAPCIAVAEASTPGVPLNLKATGNGTLAPLDSQVQLTWDEVKANANVVTGDPNTIGGLTIMRDTKGYKLYRDTVSSFTPNDSLNLVAGASVLGVGATSYTDTTVANCRTYYYKLVTVDTCDVVGAASSVANGQGVTNIAPAAPAGLTGNRINRTTIMLTWSPVTTKVDATPTTIDLYKVYRAMALTGTDPATISSGSYTFRGTSTTTTYNDTLSDSGLSSDVKMLNSGNSFFYQVTAADLCLNESARSNPAEVFCTFSGTFTTDPDDGDSDAGDVPMSVSVPSEKVFRVKVNVPSLPDPAVDAYFYENTLVSCNNPPCNVSLGTWPTASQGGPGDYTLFWEVENDKGCVQPLTTRFTVTANLACQITPTNPNLSPTSGKPSDQNKKLSWDIVNNAGRTLEITRTIVSWTNVLGPHTLTQLEFPTGTGMIPLTCVMSSSDTNGAIVDCPFLPMAIGMAQTLNMSLIWDLQIVDTANVGENVTITYEFRDTSGVTGSCTFTVKPDLTI